MDDLRRPFGLRVRTLREEKGLSQEALAEAASLHWTFISGIERGRRNPSLNVIGRIAGALGVFPSELLRGVAAVPRASSGPGTGRNVLPSRKRRRTR